jgi:hypothetical protein
MLISCKVMYAPLNLNKAYKLILIFNKNNKLKDDEQHFFFL